MALNAASYIPSGEGPLGFRLNEWIAHKLGVSTEADQRLQDALDKQAKQQRDENWRAFEHQSKMYTDLQEKGWTPMERQTGDADPSRPSILQNRTTTTGMQQPPEGARIIADPYGVHWWKVDEPKGTLTEEQALKAGGEPLNTQGQTYLGTLPPMAGGAVPAETLNVTPPPERVARTQAGSRFYIPTEEAQQAAKGRAERQAEAAREEGKKFTLPPEVTTAYEQGLNMTPGSLKDRALSNEAWNHIAITAKAPKPDTMQFTQDWVGPGGEPLVYDKTTNTMVPVNVPQGTKRVLSPAQQEMKNRAEERQQDAEERRNQTRMDRAQKTIDTLQDKEQKQHSLALTYGTLLNQGDVDENKKPVFVEDPESRRRVPLKSMRQLYETKVKRAQDMAGIFAAQQRQILASAQGPAPQIPPNTPTTPPNAPLTSIQGPPQRAQQTQGPATRQAPTTGSPSSQAPVTRIPQYRPGPRTRAAERQNPTVQQQNPTVQQQKSATLGDVRTYAQRKGISEAQALREAQRSGYTIGQ